MSRRLGDERGIALLMALGTLVVTSIMLVSIVEYSSSSQRTSSRNQADQTAFALAEAGINNAMAVLSLPTNNALDPNMLPARTTSYEGGTVTWSGVLDQATATWTLTSIGKARNPTGPSASQVQRKVTAKVPVYPTLTQPLNNNNQAWNYVYATRTGNTCDMTISNSANISVSLYVNGNLCLDNTATITDTGLAGDRTILVVKGKLTLSTNSNAVGTASAKIQEAHIAGGCQWKGNPTHNPCSSADNVWATIIDNSPTTIAGPVTDWDTWYNQANPGPKYPCYAPNSSGTLPTFDNDTTRNTSVATVWNLTPASSYDCWTDGGELKWDATNKLLTVSGTIFIDGSASITNGAVNKYTGQASLYLSGTFLLDSSKLCAEISDSTCDNSTWNPNTKMLAVVANGNGNGSPVPVGDSVFLKSSSFQGAMYGTNAVEFKTSAGTALQGPIVASTIIFPNSMQAAAFPTVTTVPAGMPGNPAVYAQPNPPQSFGG